MNDKRLTPEEALKIYNQQNAGTLKMFLGYAKAETRTGCRDL
jgi:K+-sensing histidine kinase KdpD